MPARPWVLVVAIAVLTTSVRSQPLPDPLPPDTREPTSGGSKIPVTVPSDPEVLGAEKAAATTGAPPVSVEQPVDPDSYVCGPGDTFELEFWGQQNFRLKIAADLEGRTFISKVGFVQVAGKTLTAVRRAIKDKVRVNYPGLQFELSLASPRTFLVHLVDNVTHPGVYPAHPLERLSTVLARSGGITGSKRRIQIKHRDGTSATADLLLYDQTGDTHDNPYLIDGDVVTVPFPELTVAITGAVRHPGTYELVSSKDLAELLVVSGGLTSAAARTLPIKIVRRNAQQQETFEELPMTGAVPNAPLHDLDEVLVPQIVEYQRSVLLIGAVTGAETVDAASQSKRLAYVEGDTVRSLLERAGGIRALGDLKRSYIERPQPQGNPKIIPVDLDALIVRRDFRADVAVAMGDTIVVPPMQYSVLVEGAVARAGLYPYNPSFGVSEYVARAGGRTRTAQALDDSKLIDADGLTHDYRFGMKLQPGDAILVPERSFTRAEIVQLVMAGAGLVLSGIAVTYAATR